MREPTGGSERSERSERIERIERWRTLLDAVAKALTTLGAQAWLVGGCLRNVLLGLPVGDLDLTVTCAPSALAEALRTQHKPSVWVAHLNRDSVRVGLYATNRASAPRLDLSPLHGASIADDLAQRDFTVNALALPLAAREGLLARMAEIERDSSEDAEGTPPRLYRLPGLLDPLGGLTDLASRKLAPASDRALHMDYGRILRAARFIAAYGFTASPSLLQAARATAPALTSLPGDRLREELNGLFSVARVADGLDFLAETGALAALFPALHPPAIAAHAVASVKLTDGLWSKDAEVPAKIAGIEALRTLAGLHEWYAAPLPDGLPHIVALRWGLLLHAAQPHHIGATQAMQPDTLAPAPSTTSTSAVHLGWHLAKAEQTIFWQIVSALPQTLRARLAGISGEPLTETEAALLFYAHGETAVDLLVAAVICNAALATAPLDGERFIKGVDTAARAPLALFFTERERLIPPALLYGGDLVQMVGGAVGPAIGHVLHAVRLAQLRGQITTRDEALALAQRLLAATS